MASEETENAKAEGRPWWSLVPTSGPRACLTVVGCGTLAALLAVGLVFGTVRLFIGSATSTDTADSLPPVRETRETIEPGVLDVCAIGVETSGALSILNRVDDSDDPVDTATLEPPDPGGVRVVEDECKWEMVAEGNGTWHLTLSYTAIMDRDDGGSKVDLASEEFHELREEARARFSSIEDEGERNDVNIDDSYFYYGTSLVDEDFGQYIFVGRSKSAVFEIVIEDTDSSSEFGRSEEEDFRGPVGRVVPYIDSDFERMIPD